MILITGSEGLIGSALVRALLLSGKAVAGIDIKPSTLPESCRQLSITNETEMRKLAAQAEGIVHLAAVSRVVHGQNDPQLCRQINVVGTSGILAAIRESKKRPWIVYASSREVYGEAHSFPVTESCPLRPLNVYGESKAQAEKLVNDHIQMGHKASIVRFSNVYGSAVFDHIDRVVPAFAAKAALGGTIRIDGSGNSFDFTHLNDVISGLQLLINRMTCSSDSPPPIHFVSGIETTLGALAQLAKRHAQADINIVEAPSRTYDVSRFYGAYTRAKAILGWEPKVSLDRGFSTLVGDFVNQISPRHEAQV